MLVEVVEVTGLEPKRLTEEAPQEAGTAAARALKAVRNAA